MTEDTSADSELSSVPEAADGRHSLATLPEPTWPVLESVVEYQTGWYTGGYDLVEQPDGTTKRYYWAELPPAAVVVAITDGELLLVEQYRPTIRDTQYELPAGIVEPDESFAEAAARELAEEVGFEPKTTELIETVWCTTGMLRHRRGFVLATDLRSTEQALDENEFLNPTAIPVEEARDTIRSSATNDATLEGVLLAKEAGLLTP